MQIILTVGVLIFANQLHIQFVIKTLKERIFHFLKMDFKVKSVSFYSFEKQRKRMENCKV